jgi:hypothetical protein
MFICSNGHKCFRLPPPNYVLKGYIFYCYCGEQIRTSHTTEPHKTLVENAIKMWHLFDRKTIKNEHIKTD